MWRKILNLFADYPAQQQVVRFLLENGLGINEFGKVHANGIEITAAALARAIKVDRRVIDATILHIAEIDELRHIFTNLRVTPDITGVAMDLGLSVLTIYPKNAGDKNIVASALSVLTRYDLPLRQIFVTDPYFVERPRLVLIVEGTLPSEALTEIRRLPAVESISF
ncbi:MAG TPA: regulator of amino acid metabolism, contains ACT domain protein [Methanocorpusculum sp.]|nr:regulator of amino acid metabolism, contains ACT domain protein [Methanocorpusculum sp.]